jgi:hypothetical protein
MAPDIVDASAALATAARVGPFFETQPWRARAGWRPLAELHEKDALVERVTSGTATLARITGLGVDELESRVVASTVSLGLFARLVSAPLAATVLGGVLPRWCPESLWWQPIDGGPWPLAVDDTEGWAVGDLAAQDRAEEAADLLASTIITGVVGPVLQRFHDEFSVSEQVLLGNVASAVAGAMVTLVDARPDRADVTVRMVRRLLAHGALAGTGTLRRPDQAQAPMLFVRRSCCLFYRLPGGGYCADCILGPPEDEPPV